MLATPATTEPIDDILAWSKNLSPWRQDCLRRLAVSHDLTEVGHAELLAMVQSAAGFDTQAPEPIAFTKDHFGGGKRPPIVLKRIANVEGVNRLVAKASLDFCPKALTIVYGRNGSGKSGFVRIMRTACRTRVENPAKLKVLADVYGGGGGPQAAEIILDAGKGDVVVNWKPGMAAAPELMQVAVFDTASAQLYVDGGNQIRYLPFGLALPHRLNTVCLALKEKLEAGRAATIGNKISLTDISFAPIRNTWAQLFNRVVLSKTTTDAHIQEAATFTDAQQGRLDAVTGLLAAGAAAAADMNALITWAESVAHECETAATALSHDGLAAYTALKSGAVAARQAAELAAKKLFTDDPLPGVGTESWRALWLAARNYSVSEAYAGQEFPVLALEKADATCVLCQQPLLADGAARMKRFKAYMEDVLDTLANKSEQSVRNAVSDLIELKLLRAADFSDRLEQIRKREAGLADALAAFQEAAITRRADAITRLAGEPTSPSVPLVSPHEAIKRLVIKLKDEKDAFNKATDQAERNKLVNEKAELEDRKILAANQDKLTMRRDLMKTDAAYAKALAEVQTKGTTQRANELIDAHLTSAVVKRFDTERDRFEIGHLKIGLARKSGQTKAEFEVDPQTKLTKITSDILSEGEQRALALAGFLTEVALTDGSGPIVIDDPVSSLDRERGIKVAERIAEEARERQVIVFTHDIIFFNDLCGAAEEAGIEPVTVALFSDKNAAGKIDPAGMVWKGLNVGKRIGRLKNDAAPLAKLHNKSPSDYEYNTKNLYGRLRDTYERAVEEVIFQDIVRRGADVVQTQKLRYVTFPDHLAIRFHEGMTKANTHSHDNPAADTVAVPDPDGVAADIAALESLIADFKTACAAAEAARPQMRPKK
jgi:energy-coupling factor transporter ATP-binding protein EcfA2